jgi:DNA-binding transcriptional LysR family regulator
MPIQTAVMQSLFWDDLRLLLALARAQSLTGAADILNLDATTVSRRIKAMERSTGEALLKRNRSGHSQLTQLGQQLAERAEQMEQHANAAQALIGKDAPLSGSVRLTAVPFMLNRLIAPRIAEFYRHHPGLSVSLIPDSQNLSLTRREVDVALRFGEPRDGGNAVLAQKVGQVSFAVFTAKRFQEIEPQDRPWLAYDPVAAHLPQAVWTEDMARQTNGSRSQLLMHDLETAFETVLEAPTRAILPATLARKDHRLIELKRQPHMTDMARDVWLLRHTEMRGIERVEYAIEWLVEADLFS